MRLSDLIPAAGVVYDLQVADKREALTELASRAAALTDVPAGTIYDAVMAREALGSTGIGRGVAVPHAWLPAAALARGLIARLKRPIEFEAVDGRPVDLICLVIGPEADRTADLAALATVSRALRAAGWAEKVRQAPDLAALRAMVAEAP